MKNLKVLLVIGLIAAGAGSAQAQLFMMKNPRIGKPAPEFKLTTISGQELTLTEFRNGKKAIVFFWATWCPHCRAALKELNRDRAMFIQKDIQLILVDVGEGKREVQAYADKNKIGLEIFLDEEEKVSEKYGIIGVPTFFLVNQKGIIKDVQHHLPDHFEKTLSQE